MRVIGYLRVSTNRQAADGYGLDAQRAAISAEADRRGWTVTWVEDEGRSGKNIQRPGIQRALAMLQAGEAEALVVSKLDRLSRSLLDFVAVLQTAKAQGWGVISLDLGVDTTTATGRLIANVMASVAEWEREVIGQRTKDGLAEAKARGVHVGRPSRTPLEVRERVRRQREDGMTLAAIAAGLEADEVPTVRGGARWYPATVRAVLALS